MKKLCMILPLVLILCFMVSCQDKAAMAELEEFRAQAEVEEQNKELILNMYKEWNNRDVDALTKMHARNAKYYHPSTGMTPIPFEKALEGVQMLWEAFPDITITVEDIVITESKVAVRFVGRGTHQGDFGGIPASGLKTEAGAIEIFHIKDEKIVEVWEISDILSLMQQLGMELKPKEGE